MKYRFETNAIHSGQEPDTETGAVIPALHLASTYRQDQVGDHKGFEYSRTGNPTRNNLEEQVAGIENMKHGIAFSSGSAATMTVQQLLQKGDHVISGDDVYGGTFRFYDKVMRKFGVDYDFVDTSDIEVIQEHIKSNTKVIWVETPTNPLLKINDLEEIAQIGKENDLLTVVDNTFASPYLQQPGNYGIDIVMHSTTKYLGGHSDLVGGVLVLNDEELLEELRFLQNANGAVPSPFDCWLLSRGIKTLPVRMDRHSENATKIVEFLQTQDKVSKIYYPFLESHGDSNIAKKQMKLGGGMLSFDLPSESDAHKFLKHLNIFYLAESLGGVESLAEYPPTMTHGSIPKERRHEIGINDGLVRLSVGLENINDLIEDLSTAFEKL